MKLLHCCSRKYIHLNIFTHTVIFFQDIYGEDSHSLPFHDMFSVIEFVIVIQIVFISEFISIIE